MARPRQQALNNRKRLRLKRAGACTAEVRGSNPLSSTNQTIDINLFLSSLNIAGREVCASGGSFLECKILATVPAVTASRGL
jgi:hypothetical protein